MLNRQLLRPAVLLALGALALTACGGGDDGGGGDGGSADGGKKSYTIAFQGPLSGDNAAIGENEANGVELAVKQALEKGDLPFTLKFSEQDDLGTPEGSPPAARKSIDDPEVVAVVGPAFSGATKAAGKLFAAANLAAVSPSATNPDLTSSGFTTFFRTVPPDDAQGSQGAAYLAKALKAKTVYSINDKSEYGVGLSGVLDKTLTDSGVKVTSEGVPLTKDYSTVAQKVKNANVDAVFYSGYFPEFALLTKALRGIGFDKPLMSGDGSKEVEYIKQATPAVAEGAYLVCPCADATVDPNAKAFADAYSKQFGKPAGTYSPEAYDSTNAIIEAMRGIDGDITREKVVEALRTVDYKGLTKQVKFDAKGEVETKTVFVYQVKAGKLELLGTTEELAK